VDRKYRVIVLDDLSQDGLDILSSNSSIQFDIRTGLKDDELKTALLDYDGAICRSGVKITADALKGNPRLKAIVRAGVGTDNIDKQAATLNGVIVMNTPQGNTVSTAEHAMALLLGMSRKIAQAHASLLAGKWDRKSYTGTQLSGKTLGVLGMGRVGQEVAKRAKAFNMRVIGFDPFLANENFEQLGVERIESVDDMLPEIDFLTIHSPLNDQTNNLINAERIATMRPTARIVNCARGGIVNESDLYDALKNNRIASAALDVYENEPCTDSDLFKLPNILVTPHLGASTDEAQTQVAVEAVELLIGYLTRGEIKQAVNVASLDPLTLNRLRPHLDLSFRLGVLLKQWMREGLLECKLEIRGNYEDSDSGLLRSALCAGLLENVVEGVNLVNAEALTKERGVSISHSKTDQSNLFQSMLVVEVSGDRGTYVAAGTIFGADMPRLVQLQGYRMESYIDGNLLLFTHMDKPGVIGKVGTILASHDVNIAQMAVGRAHDRSGGPAIGVLNLDDSIPEAGIEDLKACDALESFSAIELPGRGEIPSWLT
jgi:D-3-phosphoglycerate dehydrogenase / 2-oxoglutarate reductase